MKSNPRKTSRGGDQQIIQGFSQMHLSNAPACRVLPTKISQKASNAFKENARVSKGR